MSGPGELLAAGHEADVHAWSAGEVVKLWRDPAASARAAREAAVLRFAGSAGLPSPAVSGEVTLGGRPGLILERIPGRDLAARLRRQPWRITSAGRILARSHAAIHRVTAADWLPSLTETLAARISASPIVDGDLRRASTRALADLERTADSRTAGRLCHGNLHLANIMVGPRGPVVLDWADATRGDPDSEVALTVVRYHVARSRGRAPLPLVVDSAGRYVLRHAYLRSYNRYRPTDPHRLATWLSIRAVERITEGNPHETPALTALARALTAG